MVSIGRMQAVIKGAYRKRTGSVFHGRRRDGSGGSRGGEVAAGREKARRRKVRRVREFRCVSRGPCARPNNNAARGRCALFFDGELVTIER